MRILLGLALLIVLTGIILFRPAPAQDFHLTDITGHLPDLQFSLTDDRAQPQTEINVRGEIVLLYFGFTQCPDQCPATLARLTGILHAMGKDADQVHVLFVSVDPAHDTPQSLHTYLQAFDEKHMTGLTGSETAISDLAKRYRAAFQPASGNQAIMHGNALYIFDALGHARLLATSDDTDAHITDDLTRLVHARH